MTNDWEQSEDGYKTPDHWDFLYEQWKDEQSEIAYEKLKSGTEFKEISQ